MEIVHFYTKNDKNGNPRRLYVEIEGGRVVSAWDEGYLASSAVPLRLMGRAIRAESFPIPPSEYNRIKKRFVVK